MNKLLFGFLILLFPSLASGIPMITNISAIHKQDSFSFEARYDCQDANFVPFTPGGWAFQLFLDTDQNDSTGYSGYGFEFNVRGVEQEQNGNIHVRRTMGGGGPGGWGDSTGTIPLVMENSFFSFVIPLSMLDLDNNGNLDYRLEIYETVTAATPGNVSHIYVGHYDGSSVSAPVPEPATILLLAVGIASFAGTMRKQKRP